MSTSMAWRVPHFQDHLPRGSLAHQKQVPNIPQAAENGQLDQCQGQADVGREDSEHLSVLVVSLVPELV